MAIITTTNLKTHLNISGSQHDTRIGYAVNAANQAVVQWCGRSFDDAGIASARTFYPQSCHVAKVDDFHTTTGLVVATDEGDDGTYETTWTISTDFYLEPLNQLANGVTVPYRRIRTTGTRWFPVRGYRPSLQVTARWGWAAVPDAVFEATLIKAARIFFRKDSPQGIAGVDQFGVVRLSRAGDPDVMDLLAPFRRSENVLLVG